MLNYHQSIIILQSYHIMCVVADLRIRKRTSYQKMYYLCTNKKAVTCYTERLKKRIEKYLSSDPDRMLLIDGAEK